MGNDVLLDEIISLNKCMNGCIMESVHVGYFHGDYHIIEPIGPGVACIKNVEKACK